MTEQNREYLSSKNLIYIAQERAMAPGVSVGWTRVIKPPHVKNGRLIALHVSDEIMKLIEKQSEA